MLRCVGCFLVGCGLVLDFRLVSACSCYFGDFRFGVLVVWVRCWVVWRSWWVLADFIVHFLGLPFSVGLL